MNIQIGQHVIPFWYVAILLISGISSGVLTYYAWPRKTTPSGVVVPEPEIPPYVVEPENVSSVIISPPCTGFHPPLCDFAGFRYFTYSGDKLSNYPAGISSYRVPSRTDIAFSVVLVNYDPSGESLVLEQYSRIWIYFPTRHRVYNSTIVNVEPDGTIATPYTPITLEYGEPQMLVFASSVPGDFAKFSFGSDVENSAGAVNIVLYYRLGAENYVQNIPFVAIIVC